MGHSNGTQQEYYADFVNTLLVNKSMTNIALGIAAEGGEFANDVRKMEFQGHPLDKAKLIKELGDVRFYLQAAYNALKVTDNEVIEENMIKLGKRYPDGFSSSKSIGRTE